MVSHPDLRPRLSRLNPVGRRFPAPSVAGQCRLLPGAAPRPDAYRSSHVACCVRFSFLSWV